MADGTRWHLSRVTRDVGPIGAETHERHQWGGLTNDGPGAIQRMQRVCIGNIVVIEEPQETDRWVPERVLHTNVEAPGRSEVLRKGDVRAASLGGDFQSAVEIVAHSVGAAVADDDGMGNTGGERTANGSFDEVLTGAVREHDRRGAVRNSARVLPRGWIHRSWLTIEGHRWARTRQVDGARSAAASARGLRCPVGSRLRCPHSCNTPTFRDHDAPGAIASTIFRYRFF